MEPSQNNGSLDCEIVDSGCKFLQTPKVHLPETKTKTTNEQILHPESLEQDLIYPQRFSFFCCPIKNLISVFVIFPTHFTRLSNCEPQDLSRNVDMKL